jgi:hypothetical protein
MFHVLSFVDTTSGHVSPGTAVDGGLRRSRPLVVRCMATMTFDVRGGSVELRKPVKQYIEIYQRLKSVP